jgi:hypothetical protein
MAKTKKAYRVNELIVDRVFLHENVMWLGIDLAIYSEYKALPEIVEFEGCRFYKMSYNSDRREAYYKESLGKAYRHRYSLLSAEELKRRGL